MVYIPKELLSNHEKNTRSSQCLQQYWNSLWSYLGLLLLQGYTYISTGKSYIFTNYVFLTFTGNLCNSTTYIVVVYDLCFACFFMNNFTLPQSKYYLFTIYLLLTCIGTPNLSHKEVNFVFNSSTVVFPLVTPSC